MAWGRKKLDPQEKADEIKARHAARMSANGDLFSATQREKMAELGLTPGGAKPASDGQPKAKKIRDPLTKRQRRLMQELGLATNASPEDSQI